MRQTPPFTLYQLSKASQQTIKFFILLTLIVNGLVVKTLVAEEKNPLGLFNNLIGNWRIADYSLNPDGEWQAAGGADWNFYPILNGTAIQDDWIAPSLNKPAPEQGRQFGTNIRIFNQKNKQWHMAWMANTGQKVDTFKATEKDGKIIMMGDYQGKSTRITFFDFKPNNFSWTMETENQQQASEKATWKVIYKIEGTRVK